METELLKSFMDLGVTGAFLVYLYIKNGRQEKTMGEHTAALNRNTKILIKVAQKHGYINEADALIEE